MPLMPLFFSIIPFAVFLTFLLWLKKTLLISALTTLVLYTALAVVYWKIYPSLLWVSYAKGLFVAFDIFIIIFGAIFFLRILQDLKIIKNISYYLEVFSADYRIQIIILAWLFENFIEGTAGFGTPVAIVAPLLIGLGLPPIKALVVALLGNSSAVVFGAAGTPIRVGFAGLEISSVPLISALINCVGIIVPVFMLWIITRGRENRKKEFFEALPFALWAGVVFVLPSVFAVFLGQEFPSIIGSVAGLILVILSSKLGFFIPKESRFLGGEREIKQSMSAFRSFSPYGLLIIFLIIGKLLLGNLSIPVAIWGVNHSFSLFNPGLAFIVAGFLTVFIYKSNKKIISLSSISAFWGSINPFLVIVSMSAVVQIMTNSGSNYSGIPAAISLIVRGFESQFLPFFAPFIGAFGSFITGSATISNIMFGNFFDVAAQSLGFKVSYILSLGVVGAAAGNMVALSDILAAEAVTGVRNEERQILKGVIIPCLIYLFIVGIIGMFIVNLAGK